MSAPCCSARRFHGTAAALLPAIVLALLPKCPLCLAAWLTIATGVGVSTGVAAGLRGLLVVSWIVALVVAAMPLIRRWRGARRSA